MRLGCGSKTDSGQNHNDEKRHSDKQGGRDFPLPARPGERAFRQMSEIWSPWRSVAARALWSYYRLVTSREGIG